MMSTSMLFGRPNPIFTAIGMGVVGFFVARNVFRFVRYVWSHLRGPAVQFSQLGDYAIVTGSSDGIGKAFAFELAKHGVNLVLISRTQSKLEATSKEITDRYPNIKIKLIAADFEKQDIYDRIEAELSTLDVGMLINNVGTIANKPPMTSFVNLTRSDINAMININSMAAAQMSRIVLPAMIAKRRGVIVNVSSGVALFPPYFGLYGVTKTFTTQLSEMLRLQYEKYGIIVQEIDPFFVDTQMAEDMAKKLPSLAKLTMVTPTTTARQSLRTVGRLPQSCGAIFHDFQGVVAQSIPNLSAVAGKMTDMF